jgi:hypothetical protein
MAVAAAVAHAATPHRRNIRRHRSQLQTPPSSAGPPICLWDDRGRIAVVDGDTDTVTASLSVS